MWFCFLFLVVVNVVLVLSCFGVLFGLVCCVCAEFDFVLVCFLLLATGRCLFPCMVTLLVWFALRFACL